MVYVIFTVLFATYHYLIRNEQYRIARVVRLVRPHRAPRGGGAKIVLIKKSIPLVNYSFLCMLEFWQRLLSMIDKVSKSLQSKDMSTIAQLLECLDVKSDHIQSMQNSGIDEVTARATNNAEKMDIPDQLPKKRKKRASRPKLRELILHSSKSLAMNV